MHDPSLEAVPTSLFAEGMQTVQIWEATPQAALRKGKVHALIEMH
jgi:hypothetical protein